MEGIEYDALNEMEDETEEDSGSDSIDSELTMLGEDLGFDSSKTSALKAFIERCVELG